MEQEVKKSIEELINDCPKGRKLSDSKRGIPCQAKYMGLEAFTECLEDDPGICTFSLPFGDVHLCDCPVGVSIINKLRK